MGRHNTITRKHHGQKHKRSTDETKEDRLIKDLRHAIKKLNSATSEVAVQGDLDLVKREELRNVCGEIYRVLQKGQISPKLRTPLKLQRADSICEDTYVLRDPGTRVVVLMPVEAFQLDQSIIKKTFGILRLQGQHMPLAYTIAGSIKINPRKHPKILDNPLWHRLASRWAEFHAHKFRPNGWESNRGEKAGFDSASHCEPKLMLWFSCYILRQLLEDETLDFDQQIGQLYKIPARLKTPVTAEIIMNKEPCKGCLAFRDDIEEMTGLKFKFLLCPTLGVVPHEVINERNEKGFALLASEVDSISDSGNDSFSDSGDDSFSDSEIMIDQVEVPVSRSRMEVVIHSKPIPKQKSPPRDSSTKTPNNALSRISNFAYQPKPIHRQSITAKPVARKPSKSTVWVEDADDDDDDWKPPRYQRQSSLFDSEARSKSKALNDKKRKRNLIKQHQESSPLATKRARIVR